MINGSSGIFTRIVVGIVLIGVLIGMTSCESEYITAPTSDQTSPEQGPPALYEGGYRVSRKEFTYPNGTVKRFFPIGSVDPSPEVDGWISETILTFSKDSLGTAQLMNQGWIEGSVSLKWENGIPKRVGCRWVESADEVQLSWYQEDVIIKHFLEKL